MCYDTGCLALNPSVARFDQVISSKLYLDAKRYSTNKSSTREKMKGCLPSHTAHSKIINYVHRAQHPNASGHFDFAIQKEEAWHTS